MPGYVEASNTLLSIFPPIWVLVPGAAALAWVGWLAAKSNQRDATQGTLTSGTVVCRPQMAWVITGLVVGAVAFAGGVFLAIYIALNGIGAASRTACWVLIALMFCTALMGILFIAAFLKYRLILEPDAITQRGVFFTRRLRREEIEGKKYVGGYAPSVLIYPKSSFRTFRKRKMVVNFMYDKNDEIENWLSDIPPLT